MLNQGNYINYGNEWGGGSEVKKQILIKASQKK